MKIILGIFILCSSFVISDGDNLKYWNTYSKLTWNDFVESTDLAANEDAKVYIEMPSPFQTTINYEMVIKIQTCVDRTKSKVRKGHQNDTLLMHEQGHFDLQEIIARKFRKEVRSFKFKYEGLKEDYFKIADKYSKETDSIHVLYDNETSHSKNRKEQMIWLKKIKLQLDSLRSYSEPNIVLKLAKPIKTR